MIGALWLKFQDLLLFIFGEPKGDPNDPQEIEWEQTKIRIRKERELREAIQAEKERKAKEARKAKREAKKKAKKEAK